MPTSLPLKRSELVHLLNHYFDIEKFSDYAPNGLQVEGSENISSIVVAVSASLGAIEFARQKKAQALLVHHGIFWNYQGAKPIVGPFGKRVRLLLENNINLLAYHLPLDAHLEVGNAVSLAKGLQLQNITPYGEYKKAPLGVKGELPRPLTPQALQQRLSKLLRHQVLVSTPHKKDKIKKVGIITGGASSEWRFCLSEATQAHITGEMKEYDFEEAREAGIHLFAGGHHATERLGPQALMEWLKAHYANYKLKFHFFDSQNPA